jgi:hypothetical protein
MDTDEHRFSGLNSGLALLRFGSQSGERLLDVETRGFRWFLSVFICVHLCSSVVDVCRPPHLRTSI